MSDIVVGTHCTNMTAIPDFLFWLLLPRRIKGRGEVGGGVLYDE